MDKEIENKLLDALPKRFNPDDLKPDVLAPLFQFKSRYPQRMTNFYERVADLLLDFTVHEAYNQSDFYNRFFHPLERDEFVGREMLKDLPLLFRTQVENAGKSICSKAVDYSFSSYTGGTTSNNSLVVDRSKQEQDFIYNFFFNLNKDKESKHQMIMSLTGPTHGVVIQVPAKNVTSFPVSLGGDNPFHRAVKLLKRTYNFEGEKKSISILSATPEIMVKFTAFLMHTGEHHLAENITQIQTGCSYLTKYIADWLSDFWNCKIYDCFSFAELFFSAPICHKCGYYHFTSYGFAEVLDVHTNRRLDSGRGRLFVTGFYPFTQMTPLIRYATGDLVEIRQVDCSNAKYGYKFLGREKNSLIFKNQLSDYGFVSGGEMFEVLDGLPDINVPSMSGFMSCCNGIGCIPVYWFDSQPEYVINIELRYAPLYYPERLKEVERIVKSRLIQRNSQLEEMFEKQLISLRFHSPGTCKKETVARP